MYSSCRSAHLAASSVESAWFCPSGSSVTRNVERLERASTCVCTFRLPYFVARAVGIIAASSLTASALGFAIARFACGSRNSIFAKLVSSFSTAGTGRSYRGCRLPKESARPAHVDGRRSAGEMELAEDSLYMGLDRLRAEHELLADAPRRRAPARAHSTESTLRKK